MNRVISTTHLNSIVISIVMRRRSAPTDDNAATPPEGNRKRKMNFSTAPRMEYLSNAWLLYNGSFNDINLFVKGSAACKPRLCTRAH